MLTIESDTMSFRAEKWQQKTKAVCGFCGVKVLFVLCIAQEVGSFRVWFFWIFWDSTTRGGCCGRNS